MCPRTRTLLAACVLLASTRARAVLAFAPPPRERIELRLYAPEVERLRPAPVWESARRPSDPSGERAGGWHDDRPLELRMPEVGPDALDLTVTIRSLTLSVAADLASGERVFTPRVDGNANDTYFWVRAGYAVTGRATVFFESFQGASAFVPASFPVPRSAWDGFEVELGVRWRVTRRWTFEGGPVGYVLSATRKPDQLGTRLALECSF